MVSFPPQGSGGSGSGGGAPTDATYVTTSANATLSAEVLLSAAVDSDTLANRAAAGTEGKLFYATDLDIIFRDNGSAWKVVGGGPHAQIFMKLDDDGILSSLAVQESFLRGATPDAFDATTETNVTITRKAGGVENLATGATSNFVGYNFGSSKTKVLIVVGMFGALTTNKYIGVTTAARSNSDSYLTGYNFQFKDNAGDILARRCDADALTTTGTYADIITAASDAPPRMFACYFDGTGNEQSIYSLSHGGAILLGTQSDSNHTSFAGMYFSNNSNAPEHMFWTTPILVLTA